MYSDEVQPIHSDIYNQISNMEEIGMAQKTKAKIKKKTKKKNNKKLSKRAKRIRRIIFCIVIIAILIGAIILFLMSDVFNISKITIENNNKVTETEVVQASGIQVNENRFKKSKRKIIKNIKEQLPYVESVEISKKLNGEVIITITEREPTYMLKYEKKYAYINNQGYILEISDIALELPILTGYSSENIIPGNRLDVEDLEKLDTIIEIIETAKTHEISNIITEIDITKTNNFIISIPSQMKTIEFGDGSNINVKILTIIEVMKKTEGQEGTIFISNRVYFREKVQ